MRIWRKGGLLSLMLAACLLLQGCWDEVNLGDVSYITGLGVDYEEGQYKVYGQMIKFGVVAKTDAPQPDPEPTWIGKATGNSVLLAMSQLTKNSQTSLSMEHLKSVIIHERALDRIEEILDGLNRQRASRYTSMLFGTRSSLIEVMMGETFFNQSPLHTVFYSPVQYEKERSFIKPYSMQLAVQRLNEPAMSTQLPAITVNDASWEHGGKPIQTQLIEGVFVFNEQQYMHYLSEAESGGLRWLNPDFNRFLLEADGPKGKATVAINQSESKLRATFQEGKPSFLLQVNVAGDVVEVSGEMSEKDIVHSIEERVQQQLLGTYRTGAKGRMDLYNLEHHLYRYHHAEWKKLHAKKPWMPADYLPHIEVKMKLIHSGKMDLQSHT